MESTDREILIEINGRIMSLEAEQRRQKEELASLRQEVKVVHDEQLLLHVKLDTLSTFMYWIFIAAVTLPSMHSRLPQSNEA